MNSLAALLAFGFANLPMLWWLAAAAAPLLIHLWNRRKYREVSWAAMQYLLAAIKKNSRRIRLEQWILLAVRTLLIALLVLAVAELYSEALGLKFVAGRRTHRVLVLDGSFSMAYKPADKTRFDRAKELAAQIVDESVQGDGFTVVLMSDPPRAVVATPSFERDGLIEELAAVPLPHGGADLPATIDEIEEVLSAARREQPRLEQEEIYFLTDLGRVGWAPRFAGAADAAAFRQKCQKLSRAASLMVIDVGQPDADNLALTGIRPVESFASVFRDVPIEAQVVNLGRQARQRQLVEFFVDGRRAGEDYADVDPGEQTTVSFAYRFDAPGDHLVEARLAGDLLDVDNHRWLSLPVKEALEVLCVNGRPAGGDFGGATDYLAVALAPEADDQRRSLVRCESVTESALLELDLRRYDCIFLADVAQFTANEALVLRSYVEGGGGLVFFLGGQVRAESYNRELGGEGASGVRLLPARLGEVVAEAQYQFDPLDYRHPIVEPFRGQERAGLITTRVDKYFRLEPLPESNARVALAFEGGEQTGDPVLVEEAIGRGRVILVATSADLEWTSMPVWPSYLPIVQELLAAAVGGQLGERNVAVGESLGAPLEGVAAAPQIEIETPDGRKEPARVSEEGDDPRWLHADTPRSGAYVARHAGPPPREELFAVNVDTAESDLTKLELDELRGEIWPDVNFSYSTVWRNQNNRPEGEIGRRGQWHKWFLYPVLGLLLLEPLLAWWFGHQKT